ncbi:MAG: hypothetical protein R3Y63_07470 [Eubacteriales bacterium]
MKKTKLWISGLAGLLVVGLVVGFATNSHKDLSEKLKSSVEGELELRYYGTMSPMLEDSNSYVPTYHEDSIMAGSMDLLHAVLPEYFQKLGNPEFVWDSELLSDSTFDQVKNHVEKAYKMADFQVNSSVLDKNEYLLTVEVLPVNALSGLTEDTLNTIKSDETLAGNIDLMVETVLSHLDTPEKSEVSEKYTIQSTYGTDPTEGFYPNIDETMAMYEGIVVFQMS